MPDRRQHRGPHPQDEELFAAEQIETFRRAVGEFSWLLTQAYAPDSALKLVGDRYQLTARQRLAVMRSACSDQARSDRTGRKVRSRTGQALGIDGYNVLITVESALSGGLILVGRDGCHRDLAGIHGTYRKVEETLPALRLIVAQVSQLAPARVDWYLDEPVSNSGRLKALFAELLEEMPHSPDAWNLELVPSPDSLLASYAGVIATADSAVLDRAGAWLDLAGEIIQAEIPDAWVVNLQPEGASGTHPAC